MKKDYTMVWAIMPFCTSYAIEGAEEKDNFYSIPKSEIVNPNYLKHITGDDFPQLIPKFIAELFINKITLINDIDKYIAKGEGIWKTTFDTVDKHTAPIKKQYPDTTIIDTINRIKSQIVQVEGKKKPGRPPKADVTEVS